MRGDIYGIIIGAVLAFCDLFNMSLIKMVSLRQIPMLAMSIPTILYLFQPWLFYYGLISRSTMTVMNLTWDLASDILVTSAGLLYFREHVSGLKLFAIGFAFVSIILFTIDGLKTGH